MKTFTIFQKYISTLVVTMMFAVSGWSALIHSFDKVNPPSTYNVQGNYAIAGNTVMCLTEKTKGYGGTCQDKGYELVTSNEHVSKYIDIDSDTRTWDSTSSYITFPTSFDEVSSGGKGVLWAGLFWQGRITNATTYVMHYGKENGTTYDWINTGHGYNYSIPADFNSTGVNKIKLKIDTGNYSDVTAQTLYQQGSGDKRTYAAYADVTNIVKSGVQTNGKHVFTVANLTTNEGRESSPGVFGGWSLVVIYAENAQGEMRNISVYSGFDDVADPSDAFTISGFLLPKSNTVHATLALFSGEGEYKYGYRPGHTGSYDWVKISDDGSNYNYMPNAVHEKNIFDAVFSGVNRDDISGSSNNLQINNDGVDVDIYDVSSLMTSYRDANPNLNTMYIQWSSNWDYITPSMLVFATQIYAPKMCYDYSLRQDNYFLNIDRAADPIARIDGMVSSSPIDIAIYLKNTEADIPAQGISFKSDVNNTMFNLIGDTYSSNVNGSILVDRGAPTFTSPLCDYNSTTNNDTTNNGCTNNHDLRKGLGSLDAQEYIYAKYTLRPNISIMKDINESLGLSVDYYINVNGSKIIYRDYQLGGSHVPLCPPTGAYQPTWGQFNVVQSGSQYNNITTQISRKKFNANIIFDSDPSTGINDAPTSDINTTVLVEIIDIGGFGDINASCANPSAGISTPIFVPIHYTSSNWETSIPTQIDEYYNFAVQNAAFRVWYFTDNNDSLIQNWTATTTNSGKTLTSISGLYDSTIHTLCTTACSTPTSTTCFACIKENYAKPLCSRDNFSVRPESYDMHIIDSNQSTSTTKIKDLSNIYNYSPNASTAPTDAIHIAADYSYRFDLNATGHNGLAQVPGYTRNFNNDSDHNATILWNSTKDLTVCNNISDIPLSFYVNNGTLTNASITNPNVGAYKLNIIDTSWTKVDWDAVELSHHTTTNGFIGGTDCILDSNSSNLNGGQYGCIITSDHGSDGNGNTYRDQILSFYPYSFGLNVVPGVGLFNINPSSLSNPFVYMSDLNASPDGNMSVHFTVRITARGKNSTTNLSNFVDNCFAQPIDINISQTPTYNNLLVARYNLHDINITTGQTLSLKDINNNIIPAGVNHDINITVPTQYFDKTDAGITSTRLTYNYDRDVNISANPERKIFIMYKVTDGNRKINADLNLTKTIDGNTSADQNITDVIFYYGRTASKKTRVDCDINTQPCISGTDNDDVLIYYEIYCYKSTGGNWCLPGSPTLPKDIHGNPQQKVDVRWFMNFDHNMTNDGNISNITETNNNDVIITGNLNPGGLNFVINPVHSYNLNAGLPYIADMNDTVSPWLIYDENNASAISNHHIVIFRGRTKWSGEHETNTTTKTTRIKRVNRRTMW